VRPKEYFLRALENGNGVTRPFVLLALLSISARSFDAPLALQALKLVRHPFPIWAFSERDIRLLLEASIWLGGETQFRETENALLTSASKPASLLAISATYQPLLSGDIARVDSAPTSMVLPAVRWERVSFVREAEGRVKESRDALYEALRFIPDTDARRDELVARLLRLDSTMGSE